MVAVASKPLRNLCGEEQAEFELLMLGIELMKFVWLQSFEVEPDCSAMATKLKYNGRDLSVMGPYLDAFNEFTPLVRFEVSH